MTDGPCPDCAALREHLKCLKEGQRVDNPVFIQETEWIFRQMDEIDKLRAVARAAEALIYMPRTDYKPGSKKAALKAALEELKKEPA